MMFFDNDGKTPTWKNETNPPLTAENFQAAYDKMKEQQRVLPVILPDTIVLERVHVLKTWPIQYQAIVDGNKTFELRKNDRDFRVGDVLRLQEWDPGFEQYTGDECFAGVTSLMQHCPEFGLKPDFCIMSIRKILTEKGGNDTNTTGE